MKRSDILRRVGALLVSGTLAFGLAGCGSTSGTSGSDSSSGSTASEASLSQASTTDVAEIADATRNTMPGLNVGDVASKPTIQSGTELTEDQASQYDEESRAFTTLPKDSLLKNDADSFFYEDALTGDAAVVYETLKAVAQDPQNAGRPAAVTSTIDPSSDEFNDYILTALLALTYDHPEFFWLYPSWMETGPEWYYYQRSNGDWMVYFELSDTYENYEDEMNKFNDATQEFLADIDTSKSDQEIARQIHDKLVDQVTYDTEVAERSDSDGSDLAHTAYGALVEDSSGNAHHAVCDGYALAYEYLLQQCGINANVVVGEGGNSSSSGGHAWNQIELGGDWYETDATWDDTGTTRDQVNALSDKTTANYLLEALDDEVYGTRLEHYLYNVTTATISDYEPTDADVYYTKDGKYKICLTGESFHTKADDVDDYNDCDKALMALTPDATGTAFANE